ncbi:MAG: HAD family hydrolase [Bacteroides sp.]|nr:HAD family hydrolase [Bacteroides sp.]
MSQILNFKSEYKGLTTAEVEDRLSMYGCNEDGGEEGSSYSLKKAMLCPRFFAQIIVVILLFIAGEYVTGAVMLLLTVMMTVGDVIFQMKLYEKEVTLRKLGGMKFRAVRNGELTLVRKEYLVPDDIIVLQGGERVPADAHLLEAEELTVNESVFSGDNTPVTKKIGSDSERKLPKSTCIYKNTVIMSGSLVARVFATGEDAAVKREENRRPSHFEQRIKAPVTVILVMGLLEMLVAALLCYLRADEIITFADVLLKVALPAVSVGMCFIPSQADKLVRLFYLNGAGRLNRRHALVKNVAAMEELSAITCVLVEKSGTITKNHMEVADVFTEEPALFNNVCVLACDPAPTSAAEKAILLYSTFGGTDIKELFSNEREAVYPFSESVKMAGNLWKINGQRLLCIKGSPEEILALCNIDPNEIHYIQLKRQAFAKQGRQILAAAFAVLQEDQPAPDKLSDLRYEYIGLVALENSTRDTVPYAVKSCIKSGVRVIMMTGDDQETAAAIGRQIGLQSTKTVLGSELDSGPDLKDVGIFAKITPEQRLKAVNLLKSNGEIVAVVGTDTDDIAILEESDIGISVNSTASPAAAESCDMLMSDDNLLAIAEAVKESRQVHRNLKSALALLLAAHFALAIFAAVVMAVGGTALFSPVFAVLLSGVIFPTAASMFMGNTFDIKADFTPSGFIGRGVINKTFFPKALILGGTLAMAMILFYLFTMNLEVEVHRSIFLMMMTAGVTLEGFTLASQRNTFMSSAKEKHGFSGTFQAGLIFLCSLVIIYVPYLNTAFGFSSPNVLVLLIALAVTVVFTFWAEFVKKFNSVK